MAVNQFKELIAANELDEDNEEEEVAMGLYPGGSKKTVKVNGTDTVIEQPEMTLLEAWHSDKLKQVRHLHATNRRKDIWACKHCRHGAKKYGADWIPEEWDMDEMKWDKKNGMTV